MCFLGGAADAGGGAPVAVAPVLVSPHWVQVNGIRCLGTGAAALLNGAPPHGSDRYGLLFQATNRTYPGGGAITGVFLHTKNTRADPGTQIVAACRTFPQSIVFGDLNLNMREPLNLASLFQAVRGTHTILAIRNHLGAAVPLPTHYNAFGVGTSCLDFALIPNAQAANVELWGHRPTIVANLVTNASDHSVMMLKIRCN